jgi:MoaA/NifB/PqqE/SkfB family radical SAM enzyme
VIPVLSQEGGACETDRRRGEGTHEIVRVAMERLKARRVFFGTSMTLTSENVSCATEEATIRNLLDRGCRLFYYINYVPVEAGTEDLQLAPEQVVLLEHRLEEHRRRIPALFIAFPHDEVALGGCLAAGRGFVHIDPRGDVQPCPFSPFSDRSLQTNSLREALASPLLARIRDSGVRLDETDGRCALWKQRAWVESLVEEERAAGSADDSPEAKT